MSMPKKFTSTSARIVASLFVFAIIIGFVFTFTQDGSSNFFRTQSDVAKVDGTPITYREFQMEMAQKSQRYKQLFGGNDLNVGQM